MATNIIDVTAGRGLEASRLSRPGSEQDQAVHTAHKVPPAPDSPEFALLPLVDKIAYAFAGGLIVAMRELESHIAGETQKVNDNVDRRLGALQGAIQDLSAALSEQRSLGDAVQEKCRELEAATASLRETDERQDGELQALRAEAAATCVSTAEQFEAASASLRDTEARQKDETDALRVESRSSSDSLSGRIADAAASLQETDARLAAEIAAIRSETRDSAKSLTERLDAMTKDLMVHQDDLAALKTSVTGFCATVDGFSERLARQSEALRSMFAAYSQRETQLEQLVDGLTRLRTNPAPPAGQF
jgi:chromosome segregation ATPase